MKRRLATLLLVLTMGAGSLLPAAAFASQDEAVYSTKLPVSEPVTTAEPAEPPGASLLDLSLFGVIAIGVIGLLWIRRHTSQL